MSEGYILFVVLCLVVFVLIPACVVSYSIGERSMEREATERGFGTMQGRRFRWNGVVIKGGGKSEL